MNGVVQAKTVSNDSKASINQGDITNRDVTAPEGTNFFSQSQSFRPTSDKNANQYKPKVFQNESKRNVS